MPLHFSEIIFKNLLSKKNEQSYRLQCHFGMLIEYVTIIIIVNVSVEK